MRSPIDFHDDVGVALDHRHEPLQVGEERLLAFGPHRSEQHVGVAEVGDRFHRGRIGRVEAAELALHRVGLHLVRADVLRMRTATRRARTHGTARCAPCTTSRSASAYRSSSSGSDHSGREGVDVVRRRTRVPAGRRGGAAGRTGRAPGARAARSSTRPNRRAAAASSWRTTCRARTPAAARRQSDRRRPTPGPGSLPWPSARGERSAPSTGSSPVRVTLDQVGPVDAANGDGERGRDAGRLAHRQLHGAGRRRRRRGSTPGRRAAPRAGAGLHVDVRHRLRGAARDLHVHRTR